MGKKDTMGKDMSTDEASAARSRLTPIEIQQKEFRVSRFGGYKMRDVDEFLDQITDTFTALTSENDRLRANGAPMVGSPDLDDVARQADEIIARARSEAARITGEAKSASSVAAVAAGGPADRAAVNAFLSREREFLQSLAGLVQEHAESVKGMARSARPVSGRTPPTPPSATGTPTATGTGTGERFDAATTVVASREAADAAPAVTAEASAGHEMPAGEETPAERSADVEPAPARMKELAPEPSSQSEPTTLPEADQTVRIEEPAPASASRREGDPESDRSLRELFWGED